MKYITRNAEGIAIMKDQETTHKIGLRNYINTLCMNYLSTLEGRQLAGAYLLHIKRNVPVYVNSEILLFPTKSIREVDMMYLNYCEILSVQAIQQGTRVIFNDLTDIHVNVPYTRLNKQMKNCKNLLDIIHNSAKKKVFTNYSFS